mmetsp:Transcript_80981/g.228141  ORF Transcript_80981/g.228141 Transcript_80981/m.228141 type:complete len:774 (-) Transcript_80981:121-2442(-)
MARFAAVFALLAVGAQGSALETRESSLEKAWAKELDAPEARERVNPVKRVVNLLNKMKSELDAEAAKDSEMYDKMVCWCETNDKEKTHAIAEADARDAALMAEIEDRSARFGKLSAEIADTKQEIQENTASLDQATEIRETEAAKFREDEKDMVQAITNLRNAMSVLSKHQGASMLELPGHVLSGMTVLLRDAATKYEVLVAGRAERQGRRSRAMAFLALKAATERRTATAEGSVTAALLSALDPRNGGPVSDELPVKFAAQIVARAAHAGGRAAARAFLQIETEKPASYSSQSGGVFGVMGQLLEDFETELKNIQGDETKAVEDFKNLAAAKNDEIDAGKRKLDQMEVEDAGNGQALSDAKEDLTETRRQRSEDVKFLQDLKATCNDLDAQWEKRSKTRGAETVAVAEAIAILTEDDNREHLAATVSFIQERSISASSSALRLSAAAALRRAAKAPDFYADDLLDAWNGRAVPSAVGAAAGPRTQLATLATAVQLDAFAKVKELMDKMMADLKDQQAEEVTFKDHCGSEMGTTEKTLYEKGELKQDLESNIERLESLMKKLDEEIEASKGQISGAQTEVKKAGQQREQENKEFQAVVSDQRATQSILNKALMKLKDFYEKGIGKAVLLQSGKQEPPVKFNAYKANGASNSVIGLIEQILEDSAKLETEAMDSESSAQAEYEGFVKDSNELAKGLAQAITAKSDASASAKSETAQAAEDLDSTKGELESLSAYEADLHQQCDWSLKNFDIRQKARAQEMEAIAKAKAFLSGMK